MGDKNLYTRNITHKYGDDGYHPVRIRDNLKPYAYYLRRVKDYYDGKSFVLEYKPHKSQHNAGCMIELVGLDEHEHRQVYAPDIDRVYEYDPAQDMSHQDKSDPIKIMDKNEKEETLLLERRPDTPQLLVMYNTYQTSVQINAVASLAHRPIAEHIGLLRLIDGYLAWPDAHEEEVGEWFILKKDLDGASEQRQFVKKALGTPDFAFLEGPPGSGKTTVLAELVMQLATRGKRVLFCASTHVAVDNLLERIVGMDGGMPVDLIPLRIGMMGNLSEKTRPFQYDQYLQTIRNGIDSHLSGIKRPSRSQKTLLELVRQHDDTIGRIARDCANLVCGTTMGILQYPGIKDDTCRFDYMIIDEASKTTLQEFLVTAVHADRWIVVGDVNQLSPYTDDGEIAMQVDSCIENGNVKDACVDAFMANRHGKSIVVVTRDEEVKRAYKRQCEKLGTGVRDASMSKTADSSVRQRVLVGSPESILKIPPPKNKCVIRGREQLNSALQELKRRKLRRGGSAPGSRQAKSALQELKRRKLAAKWAACDPRNQEDSWSVQVGWRIRARFPTGMEDKNAERIKKDIQALMPDEDLGCSDISEKMGDIRAIALPSIMECVRDGAGKIKGIPKDDLSDRHVLLAWQYRMHPEIASFSHKHVYGGDAMNTPDFMESKRDWNYDKYGHRAVWIDVRGRVGDDDGSYSNECEAERIAEEVKAFCSYARANPKPDGIPWTVAVLSFYGGQIPVLQRRMSRLGGKGTGHHFKISSGLAEIHVDVHTVDRFQGHEADVVFLSIVRNRPTIFLNHINRINVAVTRARYQFVIVGNRDAMGKESPLRDLVHSIPVHGRSDHG